ncbi:DUF4270 domain-containing protein [Flavobacterium gilvum]|uniref:DUF4270 domain-containing protein n=1 Tax=Flavobacterium gilvum TaxID=1492737 RepID=A0AAC9I2C7_9FLAO|nr:DUF4270 domain-containing protein [Flavobacterium gilvum]AOW08914.1 hypothetical protein EM308_04995 [Flavobacterium gilvum]KFC60935.1 hypothetical protein FEM08_03250 [Flavobacterium gilvum]
MLKNSFLKTIPFLLFVVLFYSCDKEINAVGADLIGDNSFDIVKNEYSVVSYNQKLGPIQSNNLETNPFGVYNNPSFGTTNANFVTQLALVTAAPVFDLTTAKIKSVVLSIPYFFDKTKTVTDSNGNNTYVLDSIYGPEKAKMKLSVYESGYYMRDLDPDSQFSQAQKYYTNQFADFNQLKIGSALNDDPNIAENSEFFFDPAEHVVTTTGTDGKTTTTRSAPAMQLNLNKDFFMSKVLKAPTAALATDAAFKEYFRGLFFNIETINGNPGDLAMINFRAGKITITYTETVNSVDTEKTFVLNLTGNTVSLLNQSNDNQNYINGIANADKVKGDPNLYLKGGEGSMSVLKLFGEDKYGVDGVSGAPNGVADQLDILRKNKYLINEADLTFNLNTDAMGNSYVPQRIYLYDFKNNQIIIDYRETSTVSSNTKNNKYIFGGILVKKSDAEGGGSSYKFRITNHIRNLVKYADSTNVDLGLVVTEDINKSSFYSLRDKTGFPLKAPMASVMNPLGTIVFGNNIAIDDKNYNKRLKFEIYYTKTN